MSLQNWIALVAALTALTAVIVSPFLSLYIARSQLISPMRQKWIDEFSLLMSEYLAAVQRLAIGDASTTELLNQLSVLGRRMFFMLNLDDPDHEQLRQMLSDMWQLLLSKKNEQNKEKIQTIVQQITLLSYKIIRERWATVTGKTNWFSWLQRDRPESTQRQQATRNPEDTKGTDSKVDS